MGATRCLKNTSNDGFKKGFTLFGSVPTISREDGRFTLTCCLLSSVMTYKCVASFVTTQQWPNYLRVVQVKSVESSYLMGVFCRERHPDKTKALQSICLHTMYILNLRAWGGGWMLDCHLSKRWGIKDSVNIKKCSMFCFFKLKGKRAHSL